jgi:hypothetical protein
LRVLLFAPSRLRYLACSFGALALAFALRAEAEELPCGSPRIHLELDGKPEWESEIPELRARLLALEHVDPCARVTIRSETGGVLVNVTSGERSATRFVTSPADLVRTVEALVVLPPPAPDRTQATPASATPTEAALRSAPAPSATHMELVAAAAARLGGNPLLVGGGIATSAGLVDHGWLVGVSARWEFAANYVSAIAPAGFSMGAGAVGVELGHRWELGAFSGDALVGPSVVLESQEAYGPPTAKDGIEGSAIDARINLKLRASGPSSSRLRVYAAGDVEVSPRRLVRPKQLDPELPPLPAWSSGLAIGVLWRAR